MDITLENISLQYANSQAITKTHTKSIENLELVKVTKFQTV